MENHHFSIGIWYNTIMSQKTIWPLSFFFVERCSIDFPIDFFPSESWDYTVEYNVNMSLPRGQHGDLMGSNGNITN